MRMRVVVFEGEVVVAEAEQVVDGGVEAHLRQWTGPACELKTRLVEVVVV